MTTSPKDKAKSRVDASRARILAGRKPVTAKKKVEPSGEERLLARIAASLESLKAEIVVNVPEQKVADPKVTVNVPGQERPSIIVNVPDQKQQPAPIINVKVPQQTQKTPIVNVTTPEIKIPPVTFPEQQFVKKWEFTIHRLTNGLIDSITAERG